MKNAMTVVVGAKGKTGRRVVERLREAGHAVRGVSPSSEVAFDWNDRSSWGPALEGASAVYLSYFPDLAVPGAAENVEALSRLAVQRGVRKIVLLAGRGEPQVHAAEHAVRQSGAAWTILECAFFMQNFDEGLLRPDDGVIAFLADDVREPFVDCDDIADVAVAALTSSDHDGQTYELTGPSLLSFHEATGLLGAALGQKLAYVPVSFEQYASALGAHFAPEEVRFFMELFGHLIDGHNAHTTCDVERALGRPARSFASYAQALSVGQ